MAGNIVNSVIPDWFPYNDCVFKLERQEKDGSMKCIMIMTHTQNSVW